MQLLTPTLIKVSTCSQLNVSVVDVVLSDHHLLLTWPFPGRMGVWNSTTVRHRPWSRFVRRPHEGRWRRTKPWRLAAAARRPHFDGGGVRRRRPSKCIILYTKLCFVTLYVTFRSGKPLVGMMKQVFCKYIFWFRRLIRRLVYIYIRSTELFQYRRTGWTTTQFKEFIVLLSSASWHMPPVGAVWQEPLKYDVSITITALLNRSKATRIGLLRVRLTRLW